MPTAPRGFNPVSGGVAPNVARGDRPTRSPRARAARQAPVSKYDQKLPPNDPPHDEPPVVVPVVP